MSPTTLLYLSITLMVGVGIGLQSAINAALGRIIGVVEATLVSVSLTWLLAILLLVLGWRSGNFSQVTTVPPYLLIGGIFGAAVLVSSARLVPIIGVTSVIGGFIAGQLIASVALDAVGAFSLREAPITPARLLGVALLLAGAWLTYQR